MLAGALRRAGLRAHVGPVHSVERLADGFARTAFARRRRARRRHGVGLAGRRHRRRNERRRAGGHRHTVARAVLATPPVACVAGRPVAAGSNARCSTSGPPRCARAGSSLASPRGVLRRRRTGHRRRRAGPRAVRAADLRPPPDHPQHARRRRPRRPRRGVRARSSTRCQPAVESSSPPTASRRTCVRTPFTVACRRSTPPARSSPRCTAEVRRFAAKDYRVFLIGHPDHEEVAGHHRRGAGVDRRHRGRPPRRRGGRPRPAPRRLRHADHARRRRGGGRSSTACAPRFPAIEGPARDDICYATQNRQDAARAIGARVRRRARRRLARLVELQATRRGRRARRLRRPPARRRQPARSGVGRRRRHGRHHRRRVGSRDDGAPGRSPRSARSVRSRFPSTRQLVEDVRFALPVEVR